MSEIKQVLVIRRTLIIPTTVLNELRGDRSSSDSGGCTS
jgi:hypothetical protein